MNNILALFALFFLSSTVAHANPTTEAIGSMHILSMNVQCLQGDWKFRLDTITTEIANINPDVISLQEVCSSQYDDEFYIIANMLQSKGYAIKSSDRLYTHKAGYGDNEFIAIYSKHTASNAKKDLLPWSPLQRGYIAFEINQTWFVNTHLEYLDANSNYREQQLASLRQIFNNTTHILMGDFNSSPLWNEQQQLSQNNYSWYFPGINSNLNLNGFLPYIDGFWLSSSLKNKTKNHYAEVVIYNQVNGIRLSDHFAVLLKYEY